MRFRILAVGVVASLATGAAVAADGPSKEEGIGVGAGAVVGAFAGGPVGAIVGAAIGAKLGDSFHERGDRVDTLNGELRGSRERVKQLEKDVAALARNNSSLGEDLRELQAVARPEFLSLLQAGIEMDLLFRTDEHVLGDETGQRLTTMAVTLASMPDVYIKLDGFADERGDAAYNQNLSRLRAEHVRDMLVDSGIAQERIKVNAHGESDSTDDTADSYALERKVSLTLFVDESPSLASNPVN